MPGKAGAVDACDAFGDNGRVAVLQSQRHPAVREDVPGLDAALGAPDPSRPRVVAEPDRGDVRRPVRPQRAQPDVPLVLQARPNLVWRGQCGHGGSRPCPARRAAPGITLVTLVVPDYDDALAFYAGVLSASTGPSRTSSPKPILAAARRAVPFWPPSA